MNDIEIIAHWKCLPEYRLGLIELVPVDWLWQYRNPNPSPTTDLPSGIIVSLDELWQNICDEGLYYPLIITIGRLDNHVRIDTGNHRIVVAKEHGLKYLPAMVEIYDDCVATPDNGRHKFPCDSLKKGALPNTEKCAPSEIFIF